MPAGRGHSGWEEVAAIVRSVNSLLIQYDGQ